MTRKHYRLIAATFARTRPDLDTRRTGDTATAAAYAQWAADVTAITDALEADSGYDLNGNRRFDRDRFLTACDAS